MNDILHRWSFRNMLVVVLSVLPNISPDSAIAAPDSNASASVEDTGQSWPLFRGDPQSRGVAQGELPDKLALLWKFRIENGAFEGTAAIDDGKVYIGDLDGALFALDLNTGKQIWKVKESDLGFGTAPSVRNKRLYLGDFDGLLYCLDAETGELKWKYTAEAEIDSSANFYKDYVLFGSQDASLYCLNADSGQLVWKHTIEDQIRCTPSIVADRAFVAGCDARLHVIDLTKGDGAGGVEIDGPTGVTPAIEGEVAYFGTENGTFYAINWKKRNIVWQYQDSQSGLAFRSSAAIADGTVVVGGRSKRVYAFDAKTGRLRWEFVTRRRVDSSPVIVGQRVFVGTSGGRLYGLSLDKGEKLWEYETGGSLSSSPAVAAGKLVIASDDGVVYCFGEEQDE